jgi:uncharacterized damage-inducible protein DinB
MPILLAMAFESSARVPRGIRTVLFRDAEPDSHTFRKRRITMKRLLLSALGLALLATSGVARAYVPLQQSSPQPKDTTPPSYDMKPQSLLDLDNVNKKLIQLAEAIPQEKYTWRPAPDARSFAEVFLHVTGERYFILALGGATPPAGFDGKNYEKSITDKTQIIAELNKSWDYTKSQINSMSNADFAKLLPKLGPEANAGDVIYILVADQHEHLGQLVSYARMNGIVPPWTIEAQKKAAEKKASETKDSDMKEKPY